MLTPTPRGRLSEAVVNLLAGDPGAALPRDLAPDDHEDAAIALWTCYELHYRGFEGVDDAWEWDAGLLGLRASLEAQLETRLRASYRAPDLPSQGSAQDPAQAPAQGLGSWMFEWIAGHDGASLARHVQTDADRDQVLDLLRARSIYHLKEMNPTSWLVPRLSGAPQAALVELQFDEYGDGDPQRLHASLFARGLEASGLRAEYGAYIDDAPVEVLEQNNTMSLFGLHRRLRGAALGHLAAFEATSSVPSRRMVQGLERLGFPAEMVGYYDEHVEADAVHDQIAVRLICEPLVAAEPALLPDVLLGVWTCLDQEDRVARALLARWGVSADVAA